MLNTINEGSRSTKILTLASSGVVRPLSLVQYAEKFQRGRGQGTCGTFPFIKLRVQIPLIKRFYSLFNHWLIEIITQMYIINVWISSVLSVPLSSGPKIRVHTFSLEDTGPEVRRPRCEEKTVHLFTGRFNETPVLLYSLRDRIPSMSLYLT